MMEPYPIINGDVPAMRTVVSTAQSQGAWIMTVEDPLGSGLYTTFRLPDFAPTVPKVGDSVAFFGVGPSDASLWGTAVLGVAINGVVQFYYSTREAMIAAVAEPRWAQHGPLLDSYVAALLGKV